MFNDKPKEESGGIKKPSIEIAGGTLEPARLPGKAYGVRWTKKFSEGGKAKDSARTKMLKEAEVDDDLGGIKKIVKSGLVKGSELLDRMGLRQDKEYENKTKEQLEVKKAKGGMVSSASKRADGCAIRGKTRGKIV